MKKKNWNWRLFLWTNINAFNHVYDTFHCILLDSISFVLDTEKMYSVKKG